MFFIPPTHQKTRQRLNRAHNVEVVGGLVILMFDWRLFNKQPDQDGIHRFPLWGGDIYKSCIPFGVSSWYGRFCFSRQKEEIYIWSSRRERPALISRYSKFSFVIAEYVWWEVGKYWPQKICKDLILEAGHRCVCVCIHFFNLVTCPMGRNCVA